MTQVEQLQLWAIFGATAIIYLYGEWFWRTGRGHARKARLKAKRRTR